ncbi:hypothetical protein JavanS544_0014 [Streptococcus satellite phage Javan544]|uniref:Phage protein n=1 Tax=Streptococcus sanguinis TaxID=1305 RepID=A0A0B7GRA9_STRSA|nr:hypothetical protein [Streptococcus sanguinis]QBX11122.1 hypothetical protein JavanS542_0006 [Streptococcus satellite phage Javan542]QBX11166.1 hypothetical protein JavanS544_0014 [Streptococcus satellite phage Javan544]CEL91280.1 conserved protein of unknown function [Streptococcus sanguinis]
MTKTPFTQGDLAQLWQDEGLITMDILRKRLPDWTDRQIKVRLNNWKARKAIAFTIKNKEIVSFELLRNKKQEEEQTSGGRKLKLEDYYKQVMPTREIIEKKTASDTNRLKAIQLQQQALNEIPDHIYKELAEIFA